MTQDDKLWWAKFREAKSPYLENDEYKMVSEIYARINNKKVDYPCKCNPERIKKMITEINIYFEQL